MQGRVLKVRLGAGSREWSGRRWASADGPDDGRPGPAGTLPRGKPEGHLAPGDGAAALARPSMSGRGALLVALCHLAY